MKNLRSGMSQKIVFVAAASVKHFRRQYLDHIKEPIIPAPPQSYGIIFTKSKNYRYLNDVDDLRGFRGVEVEFWPGAEYRPDYEQLKVAAEYARMK